MASSPQTPPGDAPDLDVLREAIGSGDPTRAMPALTQLRFCSDEEAVPLLVLGTQQQAFLVRSLSCSGLGYKRTEQGWAVLETLLGSDEDANVRAEAANALVYRNPLAIIDPRISSLALRKAAAVGSHSPWA